MADWQKAKIIKTEIVAQDMRSVVVTPEKWELHKPGQHYDLRILGTEASRDYSVVSSPKRVGELEFGIQLIPGGILSPKIWGLKEGDELEIKGPKGTSFIWDEAVPGPVVLIGAGSGITPLICIFDSFREVYPQGVIRFVESAKNIGKIMDFSRLQSDLIVRETQKDGRISKDFLKEKIGDLATDPKTQCYVCGPNEFIDDMIDYLVELGFPEIGIKSERFI